MSIEKGFSRFLSFLKRIHPFKGMKLIPKLAFSYIVVILLCILIVGGYYYVRLHKSISGASADLFENTVEQARENLNNKVQLYNTFSVNLNISMQELLFKENYESLGRYNALEAIQSVLMPLSDGYMDIDSLSFYVTNDTIVPFNDYIRSIRDIQKDDFYKQLSIYDDRAKWLLMDIPVDPPEELEENRGSQLTPIPDPNPMEIEKQVVLVKNMRYMSTATYLGILIVRFDTDKLFKGLSSNDDGGWFDVVDADGRLIFSGAQSAGSIEGTPGGSSLGALHSRYVEALAYNEDNFTYEMNDKKFLVLAKEIDSTGWRIFYINPMSRYQGDLEQLQSTTVFLVLISLAVFILLAWLMASRFSKRIRVLSQSMKHLEDGNFSIRIPVIGTDEIDELGEGFNGMVHELHQLMQENLDAKEKEKEAELKALQAQINPHFLYNTLASISYMGAEYGADNVTKMSNSLAKFYQISLSKGRDIISIHDEIEHIRAYMDIQTIRFKNRIRIVYDIDSAVLKGSSLKLLLQPFIENAILHGMWINKKSITIRVLIEKKDKLVLWRIIDDGVGMDKEQVDTLLGQSSGQGYGAVNVDQRIKVYYGKEYGAEVFSRLGIGTVVTLKTPFIPYDTIRTK